MKKQKTYNFKIDTHTVSITKYYNYYADRYTLDIYLDYNNNELSDYIVYDYNQDKLLFTSYVITNRQKKMLLDKIHKILNDKI